jgi:N-acetylglucosamine repressor
MLPETFQLKIASHRQILNTIRLKSEISGAELARVNNLQPSTLVYILRSLHERGLIEVSRVSAQLGTAGKPPTLWRLAPDMGFIVGLEIIQNEVRATVVNFGGDIVHQEHKVGLENIGPEQLALSIKSFYNELLEHLSLDTNKIIGVGVALTGLVDREKGLVHYSRKLQLRDYSIEKKLHDLLQLPVEAVNDANAGALGIKWHDSSVAASRKSVIFLTLNEKTAYFGSGLILNENLYEGAQGAAGEINAQIPSLDELVQSGRDKYGEEQPIIQLLNEKHSIGIDDVILLARQHCPISRDVLLHYTQFIVHEIVRIVSLLNPEVIVLGGDISDARDLISDEIVQSVKFRLKEIFPGGIASPVIQFSKFGAYSVSVGATALIMRKIFQ